MNKIGVIGPGIIWNKAHKPALKKLSESFEIIAFSASSNNKKEAVLKEFPNASFHLNYQEIFNNEEIDSVLILTPIPMNGPLTIEALKSGKNVFIEKPICTSVAEIEVIINLKRTLNLNVFILEQVVYLSKYKQIKKLIDTGKIGLPVSYNIVNHYCLEEDESREPNYGNTKWRIQSEFPLGSMMDGGIHEIAAINTIFGSPTMVYSSGTQTRNDFGEYDLILSVFNHENNVTGSFSHAGSLMSQLNQYHIHGTDGVIKIEGLKATIETEKGSKESISFPKEIPYEMMWNHFVECMNNKKDAFYNLNSGKRDLLVLESIEKSLTTGQRILI